MTWSLKPAEVAETRIAGGPGLSRQAPSIRPAATWRWRIAGGILLLVALIWSRLALAPRHLVTFDEINFALSIRSFNPVAHQPQPPGYPLFVGLLKLLSHAIPKVENVFMAAALLLSLAALLLVWALGDVMFGRRSGFGAALLLLCNPPFWYSALTNPVRLSLAVGSTGVAVCLFLALRRQAAYWFIVGAGLLGLVAGFRPTLLVLLAPLLLWTAWSVRVKPKAMAAALAAFGIGVMLWFPFLAAACGGLVPFFRLIKGYSYDAAHDTSLLAGSSFSAALHMAAAAVVWSCLGVLSWVWAVPRAVRRDPELSRNAPVNKFLMLWFLPGLIFYAVYHVGDPDHTLSIIPATCLLGAAVLSSFSGGSRVRATVIGIALLLNVFLFFKPISQLAKASSFAAVAYQDRYVRGIVDTIGELPDANTFTVIFPPGIQGWRHFAYFVPAARTVGVGLSPQGSRTVFRAQSLRGSAVFNSVGPIRISSCGVIAVADPDQPLSDPSGAPLRSFRKPPYWILPAAPGFVFRSRGVLFATEDEPCSSEAGLASKALFGRGAPFTTTATITQSIPHWAAGNTYTTSFFAVNSGSQTAGFSIAFYDDTGKPAKVDFAYLGPLSIVSEIVPPHGSRYIETADPPKTPARAGSAVIQSDPSIVIHARFRRRVSGDLIYETSVPSSPGATEWESAFDETILPATGEPSAAAIAIANLDPARAATVMCTARNRMGVVIPNALSVPVLPPLGHWAGAGFPGLEGLRGTLDCSSNTRIGMIALRSLASGAISALPVVTRSSAAPQ